MSVCFNYLKILLNFVVVNMGEVIIIVKFYFVNGYYGIFDVFLKDGYG